MEVLDPSTVIALNKLQKWSVMVAALGAGAEEVQLLECGSIVSYPGAPAQTWCAAPPPPYQHALLSPRLTARADCTWQACRLGLTQLV